MTNFGSTAFITWVAPCSRATRSTTDASDASIWAATKRSPWSPCLLVIHAMVRSARVMS